MVKLKIFVIVCCILLTSCSGHQTQNESHSKDSANSQAEIPNPVTSDSAAVSNPEKQPPKINLSCKQILLTGAQKLDIIGYETNQKLDPKAFKKERAVYVERYEDPFLYLSIFLNRAEVPEQLETVSTYRYSMVTHKLDKPAFFQMSIMAQSDLLLNQNAFFKFPCNDKGGDSSIEAIKLNYATGEKEILFSGSAAGYSTFSAPLNSTECLLKFDSYDKASKEVREKIVKLNADTNQASILYTSNPIVWPEDSQNTTKYGEPIWADNGKIHMLERQIVKGKLEFYFLVLNESGEILEEPKITALAQYDQPNYNADFFTVFNDYYFIKFYEAGNLPPFSLLKKTGDTYTPLVLQDPYPCFLLSPALIKNRYAFFNTYPDNLDYEKNRHSNALFIFDTEAELGYYVDFGLGEVTGTKVDSSGNVITNVGNQLYRFSGDDILSQLS